MVKNVGTTSSFVPLTQQSLSLTDFVDQDAEDNQVIFTIQGNVLGQTISLCKTCNV